jgi:hypothetical protein
VVHAWFADTLGSIREDIIACQQPHVDVTLSPAVVADVLGNSEVHSEDEDSDSASGEAFDEGEDGADDGREPEAGQG